MIRKYSALTIFLLLLLPLPVSGASVKPLELFSEKILQREIEHFAEEHTLSSVMLRRAVDRMNREMNIMSRETAHESLKLLQSTTERLNASRKSSAALNN